MTQEASCSSFLWLEQGQNKLHNPGLTKFKIAQVAPRGLTEIEKEIAAEFGQIPQEHTDPMDYTPFAQPTHGGVTVTPWDKTDDTRVDRSLTLMHPIGLSDQLLMNVLAHSGPRVEECTRKLSDGGWRSGTLTKRTEASDVASKSKEACANNLKFSDGGVLGVSWNEEKKKCYEVRQSGALPIQRTGFEYMTKTEVTLGRQMLNPWEMRDAGHCSSCRYRASADGDCGFDHSKGVLDIFEAGVVYNSLLGKGSYTKLNNTPHRIELMDAKNPRRTMQQTIKDVLPESKTNSIWSGLPHFAHNKQLGYLSEYDEHRTRGSLATIEYKYLNRPSGLTPSLLGNRTIRFDGKKTTLASNATCRQYCDTDKNCMAYQMDAAGVQCKMFSYISGENMYPELGFLHNPKLIVGEGAATASPDWFARTGKSTNDFKISVPILYKDRFLSAKEIVKSMPTGGFFGTGQVRKAKFKEMFKIKLYNEYSEALVPITSPIKPGNENAVVNWTLSGGIGKMTFSIVNVRGEELVMVAVKGEPDQKKRDKFNRGRRLSGMPELLSKTSPGLLERSKVTDDNMLRVEVEVLKGGVTFKTTAPEWAVGLFIVVSDSGEVGLGSTPSVFVIPAGVPPRGLLFPKRSEHSYKYELNCVGGSPRDPRCVSTIKLPETTLRECADRCSRHNLNNAQTNSETKENDCAGIVFKSTREKLGYCGLVSQFVEGASKPTSDLFGYKSFAIPNVNSKPTDYSDFVPRGDGSSSGFSHMLFTKRASKQRSRDFKDWTENERFDYQPRARCKRITGKSEAVLRVRHKGVTYKAICPINPGGMAPKLIDEQGVTIHPQEQSAEISGPDSVCGIPTESFHGFPGFAKDATERRNMPLSMNQPNWAACPSLYKHTRDNVFVLPDGAKLHVNCRAKMAEIKSQQYELYRGDTERAQPYKHFESEISGFDPMAMKTQQDLNTSPGLSSTVRKATSDAFHLISSAVNVADNPKRYVGEIGSMCAPGSAYLPDLRTQKLDSIRSIVSGSTLQALVNPSIGKACGAGCPTGLVCHEKRKICVPKCPKPSEVQLIKDGSNGKYHVKCDWKDGKPYTLLNYDGFDALDWAKSILEQSPQKDLLRNADASLGMFQDTARERLCKCNKAFSAMGWDPLNRSDKLLDPDKGKSRLNTPEKRRKYIHDVLECWLSDRSKATEDLPFQNYYVGRGSGNEPARQMLRSRGKVVESHADSIKNAHFVKANDDYAYCWGKQPAKTINLFGQKIVINKKGGTDCESNDGQLTVPRFAAAVVNQDAPGSFTDGSLANVFNLYNKQTLGGDAETKRYGVSLDFFGKKRNPINKFTDAADPRMKKAGSLFSNATYDNVLFLPWSDVDGTKEKVGRSRADIFFDTVGTALGNQAKYIPFQDRRCSGAKCGFGKLSPACCRRKDIGHRSEFFSHFNTHKKDSLVMDQVARPQDPFTQQPLFDKNSISPIETSFCSFVPRPTVDFKAFVNKAVGDECNAYGNKLMIPGKLSVSELENDRIYYNVAKGRVLNGRLNSVAVVDSVEAAKTQCEVYRKSGQGEGCVGFSIEPDCVKDCEVRFIASEKESLTLSEDGTDFNMYLGTGIKASKEQAQEICTITPMCGGFEYDTETNVAHSFYGFGHPRPEGIFTGDPLEKCLVKKEGRTYFHVTNEDPGIPRLISNVQCKNKLAAVSKQGQKKWLEFVNEKSRGTKKSIHESMKDYCLKYIRKPSRKATDPEKQRKECTRRSKDTCNSVPYCQYFPAKTTLNMSNKGFCDLRMQTNMLYTPPQGQEEDSPCLAYQKSEPDPENATVDNWIKIFRETFPNMKESKCSLDAVKNVSKEQMHNLGAKWKCLAPFCNDVGGYVLEQKDRLEAAECRPNICVNKISLNNVTIVGNENQTLNAKQSCDGFFNNVDPDDCSTWAAFKKKESEGKANPGEREEELQKCVKEVRNKFLDNNRYDRDTCKVQVNIENNGKFKVGVEPGTTCKPVVDENDGWLGQCRAMMKNFTVVTSTDNPSERETCSATTFDEHCRRSGTTTRPCIDKLPDEGGGYANAELTTSKGVKKFSCYNGIDFPVTIDDKGRGMCLIGSGGQCGDGGKTSCREQLDAAKKADKVGTYTCTSSIVKGDVNSAQNNYSVITNWCSSLMSKSSKGRELMPSGHVKYLNTLPKTCSRTKKQSLETDLCSRIQALDKPQDIFASFKTQLNKFKDANPGSTEKCMKLNLNIDGTNNKPDFMFGFAGDKCLRGSAIKPPKKTTKPTKPTDKPKPKPTDKPSNTPSSTDKSKFPTWALWLIGGIGAFMVVLIILYMMSGSKQRNTNVNYAQTFGQSQQAQQLGFGPLTMQKIGGEIYRES